MALTFLKVRNLITRQYILSSNQKTFAPHLLVILDTCRRFILSGLLFRYCWLLILNYMEMKLSLWSFIFIASGALGCFLGGIISKKRGSASVAFYQLVISGLCCLFSPLLFEVPVLIFFPILIIWGITAAGDSPQFSTLTAHTAPKEYVGSALTIVTSIGFLITIFSIEFVNYIINYINPKFVFMLLTPGPVIGLIYFWPLYKKQLLVKR